MTTKKLTTETTAKTFYRVITPGSFTNLYAPTLQEAQKLLHEFGECPNGDAGNKKLWASQRELCYIVKVTETLEKVQ